jgi:hypothetical protein
MTMKASLPGVLLRAAERCDSARDWQTRQLACGLQDLLLHLYLVKAGKGTMEEFWEIWQLEDWKPSEGVIDDPSDRGTAPARRRGA